MDKEREIKVISPGKFLPVRTAKVMLVVVFIVLLIRVWDALVYVWG